MTEPQAFFSSSEPNELPVIMILGDVDRAEMRPMMDWLDSRFPSSTERILAADIARGLDEYASDRLQPPTGGAENVKINPLAPALSPQSRGEGGDVFPDLIIVLQSWSNEYSSDEINRLLASAPLARIVVCYGAWCESDGRNHSLWPQSVRIPLWAAQLRIEREWRLLQNPGDQQPLPWSASRDETFAADHPPTEKVVESFSFLVDSPDSTYRQSVIEIMVQAGHDPDWDRPAVLLIDVDPWGPSRSAVPKELIDRFPDAMAVALANLASPSMREELRSLGVKVVSNKLGFRPPTSVTLVCDPNRVTHCRAR